MDNQGDAGRSNQPGQGPPGQPPGPVPPPYQPPPGGPPPYQPPYPPPPGVGTPYGAPPPQYGQPPSYGQPPAYGPPPAPGAPLPPGQAFPPGYRPAQPFPPPPPQYGQPAYAGAPAPKKRKLWIIPVAILGVLIIAVIVAGVLYQANLTPAVTSVQFAHNFQNNKAVDVTDTFKPTDPDLYAIVKLNTTKGHPNIKVVWTVVNGTDANKRPVTGQEFGQVEKEATSRLLYASVSRGSSPWPVGQYKADVFLDGKLAKTAQFTVTA